MKTLVREHNYIMNRNDNTATPYDRSLQIGMPGVSVEAYVQSVHGIPILSAAQEKDLATRLYEQNDLEAARQLVMSHLRFVVHIAKSYSGYGLQQSDLIQEGNVGLMKAVKRFDPTKGVRLVSFAVHWIKSEIHEYVIKNWRIVKIATTKAQRKLFFNLRRMKDGLARLSNKEAEDVANSLNVKVSDVMEMEKRLYSSDMSFDPTPSNDSDESYAPVFYLEDKTAQDPADIVANDAESADTSNKLALALNTLDERSLDIIQSRWLADSKATLHDLADRYNVSAERVRQLEQAAMKKIRTLL